MVEPAGSTRITNSTFVDCRAVTAGGAVSTSMTSMTSSEDTIFQMTTSVIIGRTSMDGGFVNSGLGAAMFAGPPFNLTCTDNSCDEMDDVLWHRLQCTTGEYLPLFCAMCQPFTYSLLDSDAVNSSSCLPAPNNTHAPGGAVLIPLDKHWHGHVWAYRSTPNDPPLNKHYELIRR